MNKKLMRCPFCGGKPRYVVIKEIENGGAEYIECRECGVSTKLFFPIGESVREQLIGRWNERFSIEKQIALTKNQERRFRTIRAFFLESIEHVGDRNDRIMATVKLTSRLRCFSKIL